MILHYYLCLILLCRRTFYSYATTDHLTSSPTSSSTSHQPQNSLVHRIYNRPLNNNSLPSTILPIVPSALVIERRTHEGKKEIASFYISQIYSFTYFISLNPHLCTSQIWSPIRSNPLCALLRFKIFLLIIISSFLPLLWCFNYYFFWK